MQTKEDERRLRGIFNEFDINRDGQISREELIIGYTILFGDKQMAIVQSERILDQLDINHNGKLDYSGTPYIYLKCLLFCRIYSRKY